MSKWISIKQTGDFPDDEVEVEVQFPDGRNTFAKIVYNQHSNETVWQTRAGKIAHLADYTDLEKFKFQIATKEDLPAPIFWRPLS